MDTPLEHLAEQFRRLPGIGIKTARKLAYYMIQQPDEKTEAFIDAVRKAKEQMHFCSVCFNLSSTDPCTYCTDAHRDHSVIMVVETPQDVAAIERAKDYHGLYHVLHGAYLPSTESDRKICISRNYCSVWATPGFKKSLLQQIPM